MYRVMDDQIGDTSVQAFIEPTNAPTKCICKNDKCSCCNRYWKCVWCNCTMLSCFISVIIILCILATVILVILSLMGLFDTAPDKPLWCDDSSATCAKWNTSTWNYIANKYIVFNASSHTSNIHGNAVDYCGIYNDILFDKVIQDLNSATVGSYNKDEQFALYINAYNILAIKMILDHPVSKHGASNECPVWVKSINDINENSGLKTVWKMDAGRIGPQMYSLDHKYIYIESLRERGCSVESKEEDEVVVDCMNCV
eukprot:576456_1